MKKDKEWLKEEIESKFHRWYNGTQSLNSLVADVNNSINQLDEPEALSQELPVIPKFVADWMEENSTGRCAWWKKIAEWEWEGEVPDKDRKVYDWYAQYNEDTFIIAWITSHYEIEEEPKYYVLDKEDRPLLLRFSQGIMRAPSGLSPIDKIVKNQRNSVQFTEQEIKDYDPRYWAFRNPVKELTND